MLAKKKSIAILHMLHLLTITTDIEVTQWKCLVTAFLLRQNTPTFLKEWEYLKIYFLDKIGCSGMTTCLIAPTNFEKHVEAKVCHDYGHEHPKGTSHETSFEERSQTKIRREVKLQWHTRQNEKTTTTKKKRHKFLNKF